MEEPRVSLRTVSDWSPVQQAVALYNATNSEKAFIPYDPEDPNNGYESTKFLPTRSTAAGKKRGSVYNTTNRGGRRSKKNKKSKKNNSLFKKTHRRKYRNKK